MTNIGTKNMIAYTDHTVFLELQGRGAKEENFDANRIGLKAENISVTTSRTVPSFPIPLSGMATGESLTMAMDLGMASKTINISGILVEQFVSKRFEVDSFNEHTDRPPSADDSSYMKIKMTAFEIAQIIHSYVDSSIFQKYQNLNELIILIPSLVGENFQYHSILTDTDTAESTNIEDLPLIPFGYYVRDQGIDTKLDGRGTISLGSKTSKFPNISTTGSCDVGSLGQYTNEADCIAAEGDWTPPASIKGLKGFIRNFNTTFVGGQPWIDFTLDFEIAQIGV